MNYADEVNADLVVIVNDSRNRWQAFLQATLTQDLALRANRPVLVLHTEGKPNNRATSNSFAAIL